MKLLNLILTTVLISGCCSPLKHLNKAYKHDPVAVAKFCHDKFPCSDLKSDTVIKTEYDYIEVKCDNDTIIKADTIYVDKTAKPKTYTITKTKFIATPKEVVVITKYISDSAQIVSLGFQLNESKQKATKLYDKLVSRSTWFNWLLIVLAVSLFVNFLFMTNKR